jgi:hypothetical protein
MKLEQQVCSLELAQRLKELGVEQDAYFLWAHFSTNPEVWRVTTFSNPLYLEECAAFTVAELGEMLPHVENIVVMLFDNGHCQLCLQQTPIEGKDTPVFEAQSEANARAKMLIYLIENKLITT